MPTRKRHPRPIKRLMGSCIEQHRVRAGLSKAELARRVGCTGQYVSRVESGSSIPSHNFSYRVARVLGLSGAEDLLRTESLPSSQDLTAPPVAPTTGPSPGEGKIKDMSASE